MRPHCALYLDAEYLYAAAATRVTGRSLRGGIDVDYERLITALVSHAESRSGLPLLRVHLYDSPQAGGVDSIQQAIKGLPRVKMRLAGAGEDNGHHGVDLRIGLDLVAHAANGAVEAMYLVSGDGDLAESVEEAEIRGAQVTVLALPDAAGRPHGISDDLSSAADSIELFDAAAFDASFTRKMTVVEPTSATSRHPSAVSPRTKRRHTFAHVGSAPSSPWEAEDIVVEPVRLQERIDDVCKEVFESWTAGATPQDWRALAMGRPSIPGDVDRALLEDLADDLDPYRIDDDLHEQLRDRFWVHVDSRFTAVHKTVALPETSRVRTDHPVQRPAPRKPPVHTPHAGRHESAKASQREVAARAVNLVRVYGSGDTLVRALAGVSVEFGKGEFTAIMGPSGSGKSTLMHCLAGLDSTTSGDVSIGDTKLTGLSDNQMTTLRRDRIGFVFQAFNLIPTLTAMENITLPIDIAGKTVDAMWLDTIVSRLGLKPRLSHRPSELSGGQQQRVACARALVSRPDIIFGDEPTGNLDSHSSGEVLSILRAAVDEFGQTVVIVTHDPRAASYADRVVFLADGAVVDELLNPTADSVLERMKLLEPAR